MRRILLVGWVLCVMAPSWVQAATSAMVTSVAGNVMVETFGKTSKLEPFSRLLEGDRVKLGSDGRLTVVYPLSGRQEAWSGPGVVAAGGDESTVLSGTPNLQTKQLPKQIVQQMTRTPLADSTGKAGMVRMRALGTPEALTVLEQKYQELRSQADPDDRSPEVYLLAGLFERGAYDRLEQELGRIRDAYAGDESMQVLAKLYSKALVSARQAGSH